MLWVHNLASLAKLVFRIKRPAKKFNKNLVQFGKDKILFEYGPPSTHVVGIPLMAWPFIMNSVWLKIGIVAAVGISRIYLGVHSVLCIATGAYIVTTTMIFHEVLGAFFYAALDSPTTLAFYTIITLLFIIFWPDTTTDIEASKSAREDIRCLFSISIGGIIANSFTFTNLDLYENDSATSFSLFIMVVCWMMIVGCKSVFVKCVGFATFLNVSIPLVSGMDIFSGYSRSSI